MHQQIFLFFVLPFYLGVHYRDDKVQTIYTKGFCKGMIYVMKNLGMINEEDLKRLVADTEFEVPSIYRTK
jgi:hypothetical protein